MKIILCNTNFETPNGHIECAIFRAFKADPNHSIVHCNYADVAETAKELKPDLLVALDGQKIVHPIFDVTRRYVGRQVLWSFDDPYVLFGPSGTLQSAHLFDAVFTNEATSVKLYDAPAFHLPLAGIHPGDLGLPEYTEDQKKFDVFFCGSAWPNRISVLHSLLSARPKLRYRLSVPYKAGIQNFALPAPLSTYVVPLHFREFIRAAMQSSIVLNLHRRIGGFQDGTVSTTPGPRLFEIGASGSPQLAEDINLDLSRYYEDGAEFRSFGSVHELVAQIDTLLANRELAASMGEQAKRRTLAEHTYAHRVTTIMQSIESVSPRRPALKKARKPRLLWIVHSTIDKHVAGLEIHQEVLKKNLSDKYDVYFMVGRKIEAGFEFVALDQNYHKIEGISVNIAGTTDLLSHREFEKLFAQICHKYGIDLVHFFHFMHNVPSLAHIARSLAIPYVVSVHDFFVVCREFNLLDDTGRFCENTRERPLQCDICLRAKHGVEKGSQEQRRDFFGRVLENAKFVIYMSQSTREIVRGIYPHIFNQESRHRVHGAPLPAARDVYKRKSKRDSFNGKYRVLILGNLEPNKGGRYLIQALRLCADLPLEFHVHGQVNAGIEKLLSGIKAPKIVIHGPYAPGTVDLSGYDLSLHLSVWPETYCQTLSEAWAAGIPPIVTNLGALGERVIDRVNGFQVDWKEPWSLFELFDELMRRPQLIDEAKQNITDDLFLNQPRHAAMYDEAYNLCLGDGLRNDRQELRKEFGGYGLNELQMLPRKNAWTQRTAAHPPSPIVKPDAGSLYIAPAQHDWLVGGDGKFDIFVGGDPKKGRPEQKTALKALEPSILVSGTNVRVQGQYNIEAKYSSANGLIPYIALVDASDPYQETFLIRASKGDGSAALSNTLSINSEFTVPRHSELIGRTYYVTLACVAGERLSLMPSGTLIRFEKSAS